MLAYVFWHRPRSGVEVAAYEAALGEFHRALAGAALEGLLGSAAYAADRLPWLGDRPGYEDWYLLDASSALDSIAGGAVTGPLEAPHHEIAAMTGAMAAGVYALIRGAGTEGTAQWFGGAAPDPPGVALWRRQLVLGPTPEFCLLGGAAGPVVEGAISIERRPAF